MECIRESVIMEQYVKLFVENTNYCQAIIDMLDTITRDGSNHKAFGAKYDNVTKIFITTWQRCVDHNNFVAMNYLAGYITTLFSSERCYELQIIICERCNNILQSFCNIFIPFSTSTTKSKDILFQLIGFINCPKHIELVKSIDNEIANNMVIIFKKLYISTHL